jgi:outer membrane protein insertion porin family
MTQSKSFSLFLFLFLLSGLAFSQAGQEYEIGKVTVEGNVYTDGNSIRVLSGLYEGDKITIPGEKIGEAIKHLWKNHLFDEIEILEDSTVGDKIYIKIKVKEKPKLWNVKFLGVSKGDKEDLQDKIGFRRGKFITDYQLGFARNTIVEFYKDKSFRNCEVTMTEVPIKAEDNVPKGKEKEYVNLLIKVDKKKKVKIQDIIFEGNDHLGDAKFSSTTSPEKKKAWADRKLRRKMKETKQKRWWNPFNNGKYLEENKDKDKDFIIAKYNSMGFRDMSIVRDCVWTVSGKDNRVSIKMWIDEGKKYYFRNINWVGNTIHTSGKLDTVLGIRKGDIFDQELLDQRLTMNPNGQDISSLYMDHGYLFFQVMPAEVLVEDDQIDLEMRIYEGKPAIINRVTVVGNTKTNDRVIMREIWTRPGQLFRRSDIMRTQRELAALGYFDPEKLGVNPIPNPSDGTVDIEYTVEEKPSDQVQLSGGWGGGRVIGTLGVTFNNFSTKSFFKRGAWQPLPAGDGQKLSIQAQSTGSFYRSFNFSFTEPWLGGKRPNSLTYSMYRTVSSNGAKEKIKDADGNKIVNPNLQQIKITGLTFGFSSRLKKPDSYFSFYGETNYNHYDVRNYGTFFVFSKGQANDINVRLSLNRDSRDGYIWYKSGAYFNVSGQFTPPYSSWNGKNYRALSLENKFKWIEYHKYKFSAEWYAPLTNIKVKEGKEARNVVLRLRTGFGFLAAYNKDVGTAPFERFYLGGSGLSGFNTFFAREIIALRGYGDNSISSKQGDAFIAKYTAEIRYPISLNPQAMIWVQGFAEAGNSWQTLKQFNPFKLYRSGGVGVRIFLPMFGLLGLDYGWRFDQVVPPGTPTLQKGMLHFTIGAQLGDL